MTGHDIKKLRLSVLVERVRKNGKKCLTPLTQAELAAALGVSVKTVQNWETGGEIRPLKAKIIEAQIASMK